MVRAPDIFRPDNAAVKCVLAILALPAGFAEAGVAERLKETPVVQRGVVMVAGAAKLTIIGMPMTQGNAVDCPEVKTDDGRIVPVSYLAPSIAIGDRVEVIGFMAVTTKCTGKVLYAEEVRALDD